MENQTTYKLWSYEFVHYAPSTPEGGGEIKWNKVSERREIYLSSDVTNPEKYLQRCGSDDQADLLEYNWFSIKE